MLYFIEAYDCYRLIESDAFGGKMRNGKIDLLIEDDKLDQIHFKKARDKKVLSKVRIAQNGEEGLSTSQIVEQKNCNMILL